MRFVLTLCLMLCAPGLVLAQAGYPARPIKLIVPYSAGGIADLVARAVTPGMAAALGQPVVVENRAGAGGHIAAAEVVRGPADGYTLVLTTIAHNAAQSMYTNLSYVPARDLRPVVLLAESASVLVVNPAVPARSVAELVALAKAEPGKLAYGSAGNGSALHMAGELFKMLSQTDITHVPYKGGAPALNDLLGGQIQLMFDTIPTALPHIKAGRLRAIAMGTAQRLPILPDVPTVAEMGYKDFETSQWYGILAPAGTPREVVIKLQEESLKALKSNAVNERFASDSAIGGGGPPAEFAAFIAQQQKIWKDIVLRAGIKPD
jgi:tripartite-type tricarboxylate transporter receptor subunit TctC